LFEYVFENLIDALASEEGFGFKIIARVPDEFDECEHDAPRVWFYNESFHKYPCNLFLNLVIVMFEELSEDEGDEIVRNGVGITDLVND
jgi:hypothetical protein